MIEVCDLDIVLNLCDTIGFNGVCGKEVHKLASVGAGEEGHSISQNVFQSISFTTKFAKIYFGSCCVCFRGVIHRLYYIPYAC